MRGPQPAQTLLSTARDGGRGLHSPSGSLAGRWERKRKERWGLLGVVTLDFLLKKVSGRNWPE